MYMYKILVNEFERQRSQFHDISNNSSFVFNQQKKNSYEANVKILF